MPRSYFLDSERVRALMFAQSRSAESLANRLGCSTEHLQRCLRGRKPLGRKWADHLIEILGSDVRIAAEGLSAEAIAVGLTDLEDKQARPAKPRSRNRIVLFEHAPSVVIVEQDGRYHLEVGGEVPPEVWFEAITKGRKACEVLDPDEYPSNLLAWDHTSPTYYPTGAWLVGGEHGVPGDGEADNGCDRRVGTVVTT